MPRRVSSRRPSATKPALWMTRHSGTMNGRPPGSGSNGTNRISLGGRSEAVRCQTTNGDRSESSVEFLGRILLGVASGRLLRQAKLQGMTQLEASSAFRHFDGTVLRRANDALLPLTRKRGSLRATQGPQSGKDDDECQDGRVEPSRGRNRRP